MRTYPRVPAGFGRVTARDPVGAKVLQTRAVHDYVNYDYFDYDYKDLGIVIVELLGVCNSHEIVI